MHSITAILVHDSMRLGQVLVTGSATGEFVIWRRRSALDPDEEHFGRSRREWMWTEPEWVAIAMTFSTNSTAIVSIMGLTACGGDEGAFCAVHGDGEMVMFSVSGGGALRVSRSARPAMAGPDGKVAVAVERVFGLRRNGTFWEWALCTAWRRGTLYLFDLRTSKVVKAFNLKEEQRIVDLAVFRRDWRRFVVVDAAGNIIKFQVVDADHDHGDGPTLSRMASAQSRFRKEAVAVSVAADDQYIVVITGNEVAVFSAETLSRIWSKTERDVEWAGVLTVDHVIGRRDDGDGDGRHDDDSPFWLLLWEHGAAEMTLFAVSKERALLSPAVTLKMVDHGQEGAATEWNANAVALSGELSDSAPSLYIGTASGALRAISMHSVAAMAREWVNGQKVDVLEAMECGEMERGFETSMFLIGRERVIYIEIQCDLHRKRQ